MRFVTAALVTGGRTGHRFKDQLTARIAAHLYNLTYVHNAFPRDAWEEDRWDAFLNFGERDIQIWQIDWNCFHTVRVDTTAWGGLDLIQVQKIVNSNTQDNTFFIFTESARILLEQISKEHRDAIVGLLRQKYWNRRITDPVPSYFDPQKLNVALHIRRGADVAPGTSAHWRSTADAYYLTIIDNLQKLPRDMDFHIYSEGAPDLFAEYLKLKNIYLHSCPWPPQDYRELFTSFHHMITSDVLVNATSEFSYFTSYMNPNPTITLPVQEACKLAPDIRHLLSQEDGSFDSDHLLELLQLQGKC